MENNEIEYLIHDDTASYKPLPEMTEELKTARKEYFKWFREHKDELLRNATKV